MTARTRLSRISLFVIGASTLLTAAPAGQERPTGQGFSFKTGVDLVNVSVTVTDHNGRFVTGLKRDDFVIYEDGKPQEISQFDADRVPVSLGHRARHERQHDRRKDRRRAGRAQSFSRRSARRAGRSVSLSLRQPARSRSRRGRRIAARSVSRSAPSSRTAAPRSTTRSPRRFRSRSRAATRRRRSS